ncbi:hypothetical protein ABZ470_31910 [Streptosporangium sp. NPDC020072]|uniref:hypothetical protein n=1 Tax=Streptosporangium sp. NPDC020072 TaxID=3154788 RepID=UPI0034242DDC
MNEHTDYDRGFDDGYAGIEPTSTEPDYLEGFQDGLDEGYEYHLDGVYYSFWDDIEDC